MAKAGNREGTGASRQEWGTVAPACCTCHWCLLTVAQAVFSSMWGLKSQLQYVLKRTEKTEKDVDESLSFGKISRWHPSLLKSHRGRKTNSWDISFLPTSETVTVPLICSSRNCVPTLKPGDIIKSILSFNSYFWVAVRWGWRRQESKKSKMGLVSISAGR